MNDTQSTIAELERILRKAGVGSSARGWQGIAIHRKSRHFGFRHLLLFLLLLLLLCVACDLLISTRTATDPANPPTALHDVPWYGQVDPRIGIEEAFRAPARAATVPIGWERIPFFWSEVQKDGPGTWNAFAMDHDRAIDRELRAGQQIVGLLISTPLWAAAQPSLRTISPPKGLYLPYDSPDNYWGQFVRQIVKRYEGRITDWIIWNEVNIGSGQWRTWGGSSADYAQLLKVAYLAAKSVSPHARIVLAGDPYWYDHGAFFTKLLRTLHSDPAAAAHGYYFDAANLHLYSRPADTPEVVRWYRATMASVGITRPIWIAETNVVPYNDTVRPYPFGNFRATTDQQTSYVIQELALSLAVGVQRIEINRMIDGTDFQAGGEPFGLVRNDTTVRPAFLAYRTAATLFSGTSGGAFTVDSTTGVYTVRLRRPHATVTVLWDQRPAAASIQVAVNARTQIYDRFGQRLAPVVRHGSATITLAGSTGNTNAADPNDYVIGGTPVIVVQLS